MTANRKLTALRRTLLHKIEASHGNASIDNYRGSIYAAVNWLVTNGYLEQDHQWLTLTALGRAALGTSADAATFDALVNSLNAAEDDWKKSLDNPDKNERDYADHRLKVIEGSLLRFVLDHADTIRAALASKPLAMGDSAYFIVEHEGENETGGTRLETISAAVNFMNALLTDNPDYNITIRRVRRIDGGSVQR